MKDYKSHGKAQRLLRQLRCLAMTGFFLFLLFTTYSLQLTAAYADIPHLINYQGKLTDKDNKPVSDATYSITFRIYDAETSGNLLWEETQSVSVSKGIFSVMLGGVTALNLAFDKPHWLEIKVKDEVMSPRQQIASVGYAYRAQDANQAQNADMVDNIHASNAPQPNKLIALDGSAKISPSVLKTYDSGWFAVTEGVSYTKTHNLGTTKFIATIYFSKNSDGTDAEHMIHDGVGDAPYGYGIQLKSITTATLVAQLGAGGVQRTMDSNGYLSSIHSGYARIVLLALE